MNMFYLTHLCVVKEFTEKILISSNTEVITTLNILYLHIKSCVKLKLMVIEYL